MKQLTKDDLTLEFIKKKGVVKVLYIQTGKQIFHSNLERKSILHKLIEKQPHVE